MALALPSGALGLGVRDLDADLAFEARCARASALAATDLWDVPFSVVDIETTGAVCRRDGITEIAIVNVEQGRIVRQWHSLINPAQPIPPFITSLTGITDDMVASAPPIGDVLPAVVDMFGDRVLVGHNVRFDAHFIETELVRHGLGPLANVKLDTLALARRTIAEVPNYKLGTLTRELGIDVERHHRALCDAVATAELLIHCIKRFEDCAVFTLGMLIDHLRVRALPKRRAPLRVPDASQLPVWTSILRSELDAVPCKPGVYTLRDAADQIVYVGKSKNLRQRLRTYATAARPAGAKLRALRSVVASFGYTVTGSELEALLTEADLVRAHDPPFNDRLRNFRRFGFIKVEHGPRGRLLTTTRLIADGARYYGPYRSMASARSAVAALQDALGLDALDAPEATSLPPGAREALIAEAVAFIEDRADEVLLSVARRRDESAVRGRSDLALREEQRLARLRRLRDRHAMLEAAATLNAVVLAPSTLPADEACFVFCRGRLVAKTTLPRRLPDRGRALAELTRVIAAHFAPGEASKCFVKQHEIDQLSIFAGWYERRKEGLYYATLPDRKPASEEAESWARSILDGEAVAAGAAVAPDRAVAGPPGEES
ncbi:MAG TPA: exonuclease domain-containing protein [Candidatus Acidoferrales bacterium]|nr:exonuclease domain-containing protein [Candidatus Acidoferrales bacterium]